MGNARDATRTEEASHDATVELARTLDPALLEMARTIEQRPSETIVPSRHTPDAQGRQAVAELGALGAETSRDVSGTLELGATLGEGGMGVVRLGKQLSLGRTVAIKTLKEDHTTDRAVLKLLREAWIAGSLEHPNVGPVYDVGLDAGARPLVVLKRIEGTEWSALMQDAPAIRERFGAKDPLAWNLGILMQVLNALAYAHSRGVVHRDVKPENVMVGAFGEVYLLDWGIAVSTTDDGSGRLALAKDAHEMAGTPCYMAPEMLGGTPHALSPRTDLYLAGAILHEIVTGRPPHDGKTFMAVVTSIAGSEPRLPEDVPEELAGIVRRAMARAPEDRYESAEQMRLMLQAFLDHRGSAQLAAEAQDRLEHLLGYLAAAEPGDEAQRMRLYNLFSECRFGFREALSTWRGNQVAREGLRRGTVAMIEHELAQGDPRGAAALVAQLEDPDPALAARVEQAVRDKARGQRELEALAAVGRDQDPARGRRTRVFLGVVFGVIWTLTPLFGVLATPDALQSWTPTFFWPGVMLVLAAGGGYWARESMLGSQFNRRVGAAVLIALAGQLLIHAGSYVLGIPIERAQVYPLLVWTVVSAMAAATVDWRLWPAVAGFGIAFLFATSAPELRFYAMSASQAVLLANVALMWGNRGDARRRPREGAPGGPKAP